MQEIKALKLQRPSMRDVVLALTLSIFFWLSRLTNLRLLPIFTDEAIYLRWSQIALNDASLRFIPLTDGKQPLWHWFTMAAMKVVDDPLLSGRLVSAIFGWVAMVGIWFLSLELFKDRRIAWIAAFLYLITPFTLFYDRMALVESMLTAWGILALFLGLKTAREMRLDYSMLSGFAIGAGLLTKSPAVFWQYLYLLNTLFLREKKRIGRWLLLAVPTMVIAEFMRNIMRLSPWMHMIARKNLEFVITFEEFIADPFRWFWGNLPSLTRWWIGWLTWPIALTALLPLMLMLVPIKHPLSLRSKGKEIVFLYIHAGLPLFVAAAFGKVIFARYLLFATPALLIAAAAASQRILLLAKTMTTKTLFLLFLSVASLYLNYKIVTDPLNAPFIQADRDQYIDGFTAGWGIDEIIAFLKEETVDKKIFLGTQGTFGLMPSSFELYLWDNKNIEIKGYWPVVEIPEEVHKMAEQKPTYFVYYESYPEQIPPQEYLQLLQKFRKGKSERYLYLYKVNPPQTD